MPSPTSPETAPANAPEIHPTAIVSDEATIHPGVSVGPRCLIEGPVVLHAGVRLMADAHIVGDTVLGEDTLVYPYACIGYGPQHIKIKPGDTVGGVTIGAGCTLREHTTVHAAMHEHERTVIGDRAYLMVGAHVGHDCVLGDDVIVCNSAQVAGHCEIHDRAYISGNVCVHQFVRIGTGAMLSGGSATSLDVPPYAIFSGRNVLAGLNLVGMRRAGVPREEITTARAAYRRALKGDLTRAEQITLLEEMGEQSGPVREMAEFVRTATRAIATGRAHNHAAPHADPSEKRTDKQPAEKKTAAKETDGLA